MVKISSNTTTTPASSSSSSSVNPIFLRVGVSFSNDSMDRVVNLEQSQNLDEELSLRGCAGFTVEHLQKTELFISAKSSSYPLMGEGGRGKGGVGAEGEKLKYNRPYCLDLCILDKVFQQYGYFDLITKAQ